VRTPPVTATRPWRPPDETWASRCRGGAADRVTWGRESARPPGVRAGASRSPRRRVSEQRPTAALPQARWHLSHDRWACSGWMVVRDQILPEGVLRDGRGHALGVDVAYGRGSSACRRRAAGPLPSAAGCPARHVRFLPVRPLRGAATLSAAPSRAGAGRRRKPGRAGSPAWWEPGVRGGRGPRACRCRGRCGGVLADARCSFRRRCRILEVWSSSGTSRSSGRGGRRG
jgi:hypothetical protein